MGIDTGETIAKRLVSPAEVFGGHYRHRCISGANGWTVCSQVMVVPDPETQGAPQILTEGQIWACATCGALHEYFIVYEGGSRYGGVRLLAGSDRRSSGEPTVEEFLPKEKP